MAKENIPIPKLPPWKILVLSNLTPGKGPSGPYSIDRSTFSELAQKLFPTLFLTVPDKLGGPLDHRDINLSFESLKDFTPDSVIYQVHSCANILIFKKLIDDCRSGRISGTELNSSLKNLSLPPELVTAIEKATRTSSSSTPSQAGQKKKEGKIDNILNMLDIDDRSSQTDNPGEGSPDALNKFMEAVTAGEQSAVAGEDIDSILRDANALLAAQLDEILHAPAFIDLESSWRELKFLVDCTDFRKGVQLDVIACSRDDIQKTLHDKVFHPVWKEGHPPYDLIIIAHEFSRIPPHQEMVEQLAELAQSTQTLICAPAGPQFFGISNYDQLSSEVPSVASLIDSAGYENWRAFRDRPESDWVAFTAGEFALRTYYSQSEVPTKAIPYKEAENHHYLPWGSGSIALGALLSQTMTMLGTEELDEIRVNPRLHNMEAVPVKDRHGKCAMQSTPEVWTGDMQWDMGANGLIPLSSAPDTTELRFGSITTIRKDGVSITKALLSARISHIVLHLAEKFGDKSPETLAEILKAGIKALLIPKSLRPSDNGVRVGFEVSREKTNAHDFALSVRLPYPVFGEEITLDISFTL
ncbi:MAG: hypothetical protein GF401_13870 [Chitinivibrionales bacterium]|nr:hypothetical protein [Chitinivibrionales bacterium]